MTNEDAYSELSTYTLSHKGPEFLHQYIVDAYAAQQATPAERSVRVAFALIGLYLHVERRFTGREVQRVHRTLGDRTRDWPTFALPEDRGALTAADVLVAPPGDARDRAIDAWCRSVWAAYASSKPAVETLLRQHGVV
ncbi:MAG TPA: DUF5946 family protein [Gemmatimonadaceae bacterium]